MATLTVGYVCRSCVRDDPSLKQLLHHKCFEPRRHGNTPRVAVQWNPQAGILEPAPTHSVSPSGVSQGQVLEPGGRRPAIRPLPANASLPAGRGFRLCNTKYGRCRGERCTFAHSIEEREAWNAQLMHSSLQPPYCQSECCLHTMLIVFYRL